MFWSKGGFIMAKHVHLTLDDRYIISNLLNSSTSFKAIGIEIDKDCTTIVFINKLGHSEKLLIVASTVRDVITENFVRIVKAIAIAGAASPAIPYVLILKEKPVLSSNMLHMFAMVAPN